MFSGFLFANGGLEIQKAAWVWVKEMGVVSASQYKQTACRKGLNYTKWKLG